jgi:hypothetical protein
MKYLCLLLFFAASVSSFAQSSSRFTITRSVMAGGGSTSGTSSRFALNSTVGQPLAAVPASVRFSIEGGFWIWPAPILLAPTSAGTNFVFSFETQAGKTYTPQYVDSLSSSNWQSLPSVAGDGGIKTVTNSALGAAHRFYRLVER